MDAKVEEVRHVSITDVLDTRLFGFGRCLGYLTMGAGEGKEKVE